MRKRKVDRYELPDPELRAYDRGVGTLKVNGELKGYLACLLGEMSFPANQPWPWFVVVWLNGSREWPFEDYGPEWYTVRELDSGSFNFWEPSKTKKSRFLWWKTTTSVTGPPCVYDFAWLPLEEARVKWEELGLKDEDF